MDCLQLTIPPLPQLLTVGHAVWKPGDIHFRRNFPVYDMLLVLKGTLYMTEEDMPYALGAKQWLVLEPGKTHYGHRECDEETEIYWVHFAHPYRSRLVYGDDVAWDGLLRSGTDRDEQPSKRQLYIPKYAGLDVKPLLTVLDEMVHLHSSLRLRHSMELAALSVRLLALLQQAAAGAVKPTTSQTLSDKAVSFLESRRFAPFRSKELEEALHFDFDYISRCLKRHTGLTPLQYSLHLKLEEAKRLLAQTDDPVPGVAEKVGFPDYNYFIRVFRSKLGMTPGVFRQWKRGYM